MKEYKTKLKIRLLTSFNFIDDDFLYSDEEEFENNIALCASKYLSDSELAVFYYLFRCEENYSEALKKLNNCIEKDLSLETFKKYGKRAITRIINNCHKDKKLSGWIEWKKRTIKTKTR